MLKEHSYVQFSREQIESFKNSLMFESGGSASQVTWEEINNTSVGTFTVTVKENIGEFRIIISDFKKKPKTCKLDIKEFKFMDENYDIKVSNLMTFHLGVGPTIKKEFEKFVKTNPEVIIFSADKTEKTREKAYDKHTALIAEKFGYVPFYKTATISEYHEYA